MFKFSEEELNEIKFLTSKDFDTFVFIGSYLNVESWSSSLSREGMLRFINHFKDKLDMINMYISSEMRKSNTMESLPRIEKLISSYRVLLNELYFFTHHYLHSFTTSGSDNVVFLYYCRQTLELINTKLGLSENDSDKNITYRWSYIEKALSIKNK